MPEERQPCIYIMASDRLGALSALMRRLAQHRSGPWFRAPAGIGAQWIAGCRIESGMTERI